MNQAAKKTNDEFMMSPKVDVCFAGLMENPIVRKGFCAAVLRVSPETIENTELLPTHLRRNYTDDKLGVLDVRVRMKDGLQINMEMQVKKFEFWDERAMFYISKMFSDQLKSGENGSREPNLEIYAKEAAAHKNCKPQSKDEVVNLIDVKTRQVNDLFEQLNNTGQDKAIERVELLTKIPERSREIICAGAILPEQDRIKYPSLDSQSGRFSS